MNWEINNDILQKYNLTRAEFLYLLLNTENESIQSIKNTLLNKGIVEKDLFSQDQVVLSDNTKDLIAKILLESSKQVQKAQNKESLLDIVEAMRNCYKQHGLVGKKPGTSYQWQCSKGEVESKLKVVIAKYNASFTLEQAVTATNRFLDDYMKSHTDLKFIPLLKYFILRNQPEMKSDFLSYLDNEDSYEESQSYWNNDNAELL